MKLTNELRYQFLKEFNIQPLEVGISNLDE